MHPVSPAKQAPVFWSFPWLTDHSVSIQQLIPLVLSIVIPCFLLLSSFATGNHVELLGLKWKQTKNHGFQIRSFTVCWDYLYHLDLFVAFGFSSAFLFHTPDHCAVKACLSERKLLYLAGISGQVLEKTMALLLSGLLGSLSFLDMVHFVFLAVYMLTFQP